MARQQIEGIKGLSAQLLELADLDAGKVTRAAVSQAGTVVVRVARQNIPTNDRDYLQYTYTGRKVAPGFAKANIAKKTKLSRDGRTANVFVGVKPEAFYAVQFVELGTSKQAKQPWLEPAFRSTQNLQIARFGQVLKRKIEVVSKKRRGR